MEDIKYKFTAIGRRGARQVFPKNGNTLVINWEKSEERAFFRKTPKGKLTFTEEDFHWLFKLEKSGYRCDPVTLIVEKKCLGSFSDFIVCSLYLNTGDWDQDQCSVQLEPQIEDKYACYESNKDTELNLLLVTPSSQIANLLQGSIEQQECSGFFEDGEPGWCGAGSSEDGWVIQSYYQISSDTEFGGLQPYSYQVMWIREVIDSVTPLPSPWINIGSGSYARKPLLYNYTTFSNVLEYGYTYQFGGRIDNGMKLKDAFQKLLDISCPELILKSNFFRWNPDPAFDNNNNYVTGTTSKVQNLLLFQKSDVKRPGTSNDATVAISTPEKMFKDICNIFNLKWDITDDGYFIIEHVSYFVKAVGMDLTIRPDKYKRVGTNKYSYDIDNMPAKEVFTMPDDKYQNGDFKGKPIEYRNSCVGKGDNKTKDWIVENIMTDVQLALNNPSSDSQIISDDGFMLIACDAGGGILYEDPILLSNSYLNNTLSWARLHIDYWRHDRVFNKMIMNEVETAALSIIPTKKQIKINVDLCCEDFDPEELVHTDLGDGSVSEAVFDLYKENLSLTLLYSADEGLIINDPPVANVDTAETFVGITIDIDVLANDTDSDGEINPASLEIITDPAHGTASIVSDKIRYVPSPGYTGLDSIIYRIKDDWNESSNNGIVSIVVKPGTPLPVAGDDSFTTGENIVLNVGDLLDNDSGDGTLHCVPETKATDEGGTVQIFANGSFTYTPPVDFSGTDGFDYTLIDSNSNTDTGHATVEVFPLEDVYVRYTEDNETTTGIPWSSEECLGFPEPGDGTIGSETTIDQHFHFFSDPAGTVPLNVNGYALIIKLGLSLTTNTGTTNSSENISVSGTSWIRTNIRKHYEFDGCSGVEGIFEDHSYSILTSPKYTVI